MVDWISLRKKCRYHVCETGDSPDDRQTEVLLTRKVRSKRIEGSIKDIQTKSEEKKMEVSCQSHMKSSMQGHANLSFL